MISLSGLVKSNLADHQFRAGVDLVSSSALNAIAGLAFWFVAARGFDESVVGLNAVLITTMGSISNFASVGMQNGLIRYMPSYGQRAAALVGRTYALSGAITLILTPLVALFLVNRVDELTLFRSWPGVAGFTFACLLWTIFDLQDSVLVALRQTKVIPAANLAHALSKLALLVLLAASTSPQWSIFTAWAAPVVLIVAVVNVVSFRSMGSFTSPGHTKPEAGLARFAAGEHGGTILELGLFDLLPIFVLISLGERASAFYALAFTIAYNLMLVNTNVSTALLAAAAHDANQLSLQASKAAKQMALFVLPAAFGIVAFAPLGLRVFGSSYSSEGSGLLRLLALAGIANIAVAVSIGVLRARRRVGWLFALYAFRTVVTGGLCVFLSNRFGLIGIGWGWFIGEWTLAGALVLFHWRGSIVTTPAARSISPGT